MEQPREGVANRSQGTGGCSERAHKGTRRLVRARTSEKGTEPEHEKVHDRRYGTHRSHELPGAVETEDGVNDLDRGMGVKP